MMSNYACEKAKSPYCLTWSISNNLIITHFTPHLRRHMDLCTLMKKWTRQYSDTYGKECCILRVTHELISIYYCQNAYQ